MPTTYGSFASAIRANFQSPLFGVGTVGIEGVSFVDTLTGPGSAAEAPDLHMVAVLVRFK